MLDLPRHVRLTGGDYFMHGLDRRMRRAGLPGNVCRVAIRLEGRIDKDRLRQRVQASPIFNWLGRVRLVRVFPVLPPLWRVSSTSATVLYEHSGCADEAAAAALPSVATERDLQAARCPAVALDLVEYSKDSTADLIFSWNHALMDGNGVELLLRHLNPSISGATPGPEDLVDAGQVDFRPARWLRGYWRRVLLARGSLALIDSTCKEPLFSFLRKASGQGPCRNFYRAIAFDDQETARIDAHCHDLKAEFRRSQFHLAATAKAVHAVAARRGETSSAYLIPVPHNFRRSGAMRPMFSNQLSFLFYRLAPGVVSNMAATLSELTRQTMEQASKGTPQSFSAAMELFKPMPLDIYVNRLGRPTRGKFASFFFSDAGETCAGMEEFFGGRIASVRHFAPASRPPGLTVLFSRFRGRLSLIVGWIDNCLSAAEVDLFEGELRSALLNREVK